MKEYGVVTAVDGSHATVMIPRYEMCGECHACAVGREKMTTEATADNPVHAASGQRVAVEMEFMNVFTASMIAYGIPLIMLIVGFGIGWLIAPALGWDQMMTSFSLGLILVAVTYLVIHLLEKRGAFKSKYKPTITEILPDDFKIPINSCKSQEK